jgi:hypothetical protein
MDQAEKLGGTFLSINISEPEKEEFDSFYSSK